MAEPAGGHQSRLIFADNLRSALVILVVLHHIALIYGGVAPFYYVEPQPFGTSAFRILLVFVLTNQAWFMGALFLLSGYFTPSSCNRKGSIRFVKERLWRLGIPLLVFFFILNPLSSLGLHLMPAAAGRSAPPLDWSSYPELIGLGPMWFVLMLIVFDLGYAGWRTLPVKDPPTFGRLQSTGGIFLTTGAVILALASSSFLIRMWIPIGKAVLGFPTLSYFPQYLAFFLIGIAAARTDTSWKLSPHAGLAGLCLAAAATVLLFPLAISGRLFSLQLGPQLTLALGNGHWQSAAYALWDSAFAVGLCLGLIAGFQRLVNRSGPFGQFLHGQSFTVYVIHTPVIVLLAWFLQPVQLGPLTKFGFASCVMVPTCFGAAYLLNQIYAGIRAIRSGTARTESKHLS
ncbi:MAG: acyltransferase family protein [Opitutaceae bacterium]